MNHDKDQNTSEIDQAELQDAGLRIDLLSDEDEYWLSRHVPFAVIHDEGGRAYVAL